MIGLKKSILKKFIRSMACLNIFLRKCEFDDRDNAPKHCIGKEFDKRPCKGPPCRPFWDYSEWDKCDCLSLKTHRKRICKRITSKDTADILPDRDCYGLTSEPLEKNCVGPEVSYSGFQIRAGQVILPSPSLSPRISI